MSWQEYQRLELIGDQSSSGVLNALRNGLKSAIARLTATTEPQIWPTQTRDGQVQWNAYDPMTHQSLEFVTEDDLRIWLENRHYQSGYLAG